MPPCLPKTNDLRPSWGRVLALPMVLWPHSPFAVTHTEIKGFRTVLQSDAQVKSSAFQICSITASLNVMPQPSISRLSEMATWHRHLQSLPPRTKQLSCMVFKLDCFKQIHNFGLSCIYSFSWLHKAHCGEWRRQSSEEGWAEQSPDTSIDFRLQKVAAQ